MAKELPRYGDGERGVFVFDEKKQKLVPLKRPLKKRVSAPFVQQDTIEPTVSHATREGKVFESKSALRRHYRENGFYETGGAHLDASHKRAIEESQEEIDRKIREDVEKSYYDVKYDRVEFTEEEKLAHKIEEEKYRSETGCKPKKLKNY